MSDYLDGVPDQPGLVSPQWRPKLPPPADVRSDLLLRCRYGSFPGVGHACGALPFARP